MRVILSIIAILGIGGGILVVGAVMKTPGSGPLGFVLAFVYGSIPFAIGTVALGALAVVLAIERAADDQVGAVNRNTEVMLNEARLAEHHRTSHR